MHRPLLNASKLTVHRPFRAFGGPNSVDMACWACLAMDGLSVSISGSGNTDDFQAACSCCCSSGCDGLTFAFQRSVADAEEYRVSFALLQGDEWIDQ